MTTCPRCQNPVSDPPPPFCPHCGAAVGPSAPQPGETADREPAIPAPGPEAGGSAAGPGPAGTPWEHRQRLGFVAALVETVKQTLFSPAELFRSLRPSGGLFEPLVYGVIVGWTAQIVATLYQFVFQAASLQYARDMPEPFRRFAADVGSVAGFVGVALFGWVWVVIGLFLGSAIVHLMLLVLGAARKDFEATFRVSCYSQTANLFAVVPFCGSLIGGVYAIVLAIIGLSEVHGIGKGQAAAAVLLPMFLCCCCFAVAIAMAVGGLAGLAGSLPQ